MPANKNLSIGSLEISDSTVSQQFLSKLNDSLRRIGSYVTKATSTTTGTGSTTIINNSTSGQLVLSSPGTQAIQSNVAPVVSLPTSTQYSILLAYLKQAPIGGSLTAQIYVTGNPWGPVITLTGTSFSASLSGVAAIAANAIIRLDVTGVPSDFPGSDLTVILR